jgi:hypothetical protein
MKIDTPRISYLTAAATTYAALRKERRRNIINVTKLDRKSEGAQCRDLRFASGTRFAVWLANLARGVLEHDVGKHGCI